MSTRIFAAFQRHLLPPLTATGSLWPYGRRTEAVGLNFAERLIVKNALSHLLSHWPAHLVWVFPVVAFLVPSLKAYEVAHPGAEISQAIGIALTVLARYIAPYVGASA